MVRSGLPALLCALLATACWGKGGGQAEAFEQTFLPVRQPNDDPASPRMMAQLDRGDGTLQPVRPEMTLPPAQQDRLMWGRRYVVRGTTVYNPTWNTTSRVVEEVLTETVEVQEPFVVRGLSAPYFGPDGRSLVDGKRLVCADEGVCAALDAAIAEGKTFDLSMRFGSAPEDDLVVLGL